VHSAHKALHQHALQRCPAQSRLRLIKSRATSSEQSSAAQGVRIGIKDYGIKSQRGTVRKVLVAVMREQFSLLDARLCDLCDFPHILVCYLDEGVRSQADTHAHQEPDYALMIAVQTPKNVVFQYAMLPKSGRPTHASAAGQ